MKIAILGTGGVGGYFGGRLARAGNEVWFLARGEHLNVMRTDGLTVKSILGDFKIEAVHASDKISDIPEVDLIILGVKAWQVKDVGRELGSLMHDQTLVLPLQNGVMACKELKEFVSPDNILNGLCRIISMIESPGVIKHFGLTPAILFGEIDNKKTNRVVKIAEILNNAGINAKIAEDINAEVWKKFIAICTSGLMAVSKTNYGEARELKETRQMLFDLMEEIYQISQKAGISIDHQFINDTVSYIDTFPPETTSSLTRDVWDGRPSEIEYQNGTVVRLGKKYGVPTPLNEFIYNCILPMEIKARNSKK